MGKEFKQLFRTRLIEDYWQAFSSLEAGEGKCFCPPSEDSMETAFELFCRLTDNQVFPTRVLPSPEGGVGLCFSRNDRYADLECFNSGNTLAAISDRHGKVDVFEVDPLNEKEMDDVIFRIGQFLDSNRSETLPRPASYR